MKKKAAVVKPTVKPEWGEGPWAVAAPPPKAALKSLPVAPRPALEDVFNQKVKQHYGALENLRAPRQVWLVRGVLIAVAVAVWLVALFHKP